MKIKRRYKRKRKEALLVLNRMRQAKEADRRVDISKGSPCNGCHRLSKNKNEGDCVTCIEAALYAEAIEESSPYCPAIDYRQPYTLNESRRIMDESVI